MAALINPRLLGEVFPAWRWWRRQSIAVQWRGYSQLDPDYILAVERDGTGYYAFYLEVGGTFSVCTSIHPSYQQALSLVVIRVARESTQQGDLTKARLLLSMLSKP